MGFEPVELPEHALVPRLNCPRVHILRADPSKLIPQRLRTFIGTGARAATLLAIAALTSVPALALDQPAKVVDQRAKQIAAAKPEILSLKDALLHDDASPVTGAPDGDVTIVAFVDYNCAYCKRSEADLRKLIEDDHRIKVIYKDWPVIAKTSVAAAKVAIAAKWQGKYAEMHQALMGMRAGHVNDADLGQAAVAAGVDVSKLNNDLDKRDSEIVALLKRNMQEADALQIKGTPVYLIGPFIAAQPLDLAGFRKIVADAREDQAATRAKLR